VADQLDAKAIDALTSMGRYLRSLKAFSLHADTAIDEVLTTGQKIQFAGSLEYTVEFPNRLRAEVRSDRRTRDYYFDGKSLTQYAAILKWDVAPKLRSSTFVFTPPKDAKRIEMATVQAAVKN
jgi:hypothetical protein